MLTGVERLTTQKTPVKANCELSLHGCCSDGVTAALGPNNGGCPSICQCNPLGSLSETCDPVSLKCECRTGVGGDKCDRCLPGYWGLTRNDASGRKGCKRMCTAAITVHQSMIGWSLRGH